MAEELILYNSAYTGEQIDTAIGAVLDNKDAWSGKQDELTGTKGQMVGFDDQGKPVAVEPQMPKGVSATLTASGWDATTKLQAVPVMGVLADGSKQSVRPYPAHTREDAAAYGAAGIICVGYSANMLVFQCDTIPTADINILVEMEGAVWS